MFLVGGRGQGSGGKWIKGASRLRVGYLEYRDFNREVQKAREDLKKGGSIYLTSRRPNE